MTSGIARYAAEHGYTHAQVLQKRAAGIALAAVTIHAMTPRHAHWGGGDYPPIGARLEAMIGGHNLPEESIFWPFTACLLISLLRQNGRRLDYQGGSYRSLAITLLHELQ